MTPKQKAINLFNSYVKLLPLGSNVERAKQGALIAVNEILNSRPLITDSQLEYQYYWQEVKKEINNL